MPFREFKRNDLFYNRIKTFPKCEFIINDSKVYFNGLKNTKGKLNNLHGTSQGFVSLYELNVDRPIDKGTGAPPDGKSIYPFISKDSARIAFKTISTSEFDTTSQFQYGDYIKGDYPLTSSIKRTRFAQTTDTFITVNNEERFHGSYLKLTSNKRFINALKNTFNEYVHQSHHHCFDDTTNPYSGGTNDMGLSGWDKSKQEISLIEIPSIFYGSSIKKGSVSLKFYITGALAAELRDTKKNGELVQVSGTINAATNNGKVAGVVLYNEGFVCLTGSWDLNANHSDKYIGNDNYNPKWKYFGVGANDGTSAGTLVNSMFVMDFEGVNYVPTITMFAHAPKGELNNSTNPTSYSKDSVKDPVNSGVSYREHKDLSFSKMEHSEYATTSSYVKQTYISKIGIYDDKKRLIGVAKLANPVRKTEDREYTFKLRLDI
tara:strand:- start:716 stop:2011 length:1296 start_codon:yes stop_codon:yes gene_type:complete